jgi:hypothetical protein
MVMSGWKDKWKCFWETRPYKCVAPEIYTTVAAISLAIAFGGLAVYEAHEAATARLELIAVKKEAVRLSSVLLDAKLRLNGNGITIAEFQEQLVRVEQQDTGCMENWRDSDATVNRLAADLDVERKLRLEAELLRAAAEKQVRRQRMAAKVIRVGTTAPKN